MGKKIGVYIHIPFCDEKCPYCDFYSLNGNEKMKEDYKIALSSQIKHWGEKLNTKADTLYFGGGTPNLLGKENLVKLIEDAKEQFSFDDAEITVEVNPTSEDLGETFDALVRAGVNRVSIGLQSANEQELKLLGRKHTALQAQGVVQQAKSVGIKNISLDLMLGISGQTMQSLKHSVEFCMECDVQHISAYMLKIEQGTPYYKKKDLILPNEDDQCELYFELIRLMKLHGMHQYEISNFAKEGHESRHNLKYWHDEEYLGIGASAHSMIDCKRFYYPRDIEKFISSPEIIQDGIGGDYEEYLMLAMRLTEGLCEEKSIKRFGKCIPQKYRERSIDFVKNGFMINDETGIRFTENGFLISNYILSELLQD